MSTFKYLVFIFFAAKAKDCSFKFGYSFHFFPDVFDLVKTNNKVMINKVFFRNFRDIFIKDDSNLVKLEGVDEDPLISMIFHVFYAKNNLFFKGQMVTFFKYNRNLIIEDLLFFWNNWVKSKNWQNRVTVMYFGLQNIFITFFKMGSFWLVIIKDDNPIFPSLQIIVFSIELTNWYNQLVCWVEGKGPNVWLVNQLRREFWFVVC